jgi:hypothetical protein
MATAEKGSLLKNIKIKIKDDKEKDKEEKTSSKDQIKFNVSGGEEQKEKEEKDKESSKFSQDNKEIANEKFELSEHEENSNSKIIKENSEEANNAQNSSKEEEKSENKSGYNYKNTNEKEGENNFNGSGGTHNSRGGAENNNNNNSSFLNSNHYNNLQNLNENEDELNESGDENNSCFIDRTKPFLTTGKFMQIQPHFGIFSRQVEDLHNGLYENTKKCLIYKSSLQQSENLIREKANSVVKDLVDKIFNLRQMFSNANRTISLTINDVNQNVIRVTQIQAKTKKEINDCDHRINDCEGQIGYKLLGKPNYSFMKRFCSTTTK